jgi:hypothetical protein
VELKPPGTLLDTVNHAEQRGFIARASDLREMKDMRNMIAAPPRRRRKICQFMLCAGDVWRSSFMQLSPLLGGEFMWDKLITWTGGLDNTMPAR